MPARLLALFVVANLAVSAAGQVPALPTPEQETKLEEWKGAVAEAGRFGRRAT